MTSNLLDLIQPYSQDLFDLLGSYPNHLSVTRTEPTIVIDDFEVFDMIFLIEIDLSMESVAFVVECCSPIAITNCYGDVPGKSIADSFLELCHNLKRNYANYYSDGSGNEDYEWFRLEFPLKLFRINSLKESVTSIQAYNNSVRSYINAYLK